jgi:hypothetical protein
MNSQHRKLKSDNNNFVPEEGQRDFLCCNKESLRCPSLGVDEVVLPDETVQAMKELGEILRGIHNRLISEGYTIRDGIITKPNANTKNTNK